MSFGENLRYLRETRGLTQDEFSRIVGISRPSIGAYEKDQRAPDFQALRKFCDFFKTDMDHLLSDEKPYAELSVGEKIKQLRKSSGETQADLARLLGVSCQTVSAWENRQKQPRMKYLLAMSRYYGVEPSWFAENDDEAKHGCSQKSMLRIVDDAQKLEQEKETIEKYRKLPERYKSVVRQLIDALF